MKFMVGFGGLVSVVVFAVDVLIFDSETLLSRLWDVELLSLRSPCERSSSLSSSRILVVF
jgi:hypothetical protein